MCHQSIEKQSYDHFNILSGIGFGAFQSVDFALVMDVLPDERDKAKDIAVWHQALILPNALATPTGGLIVDYFESVNCELGLGYIILFILTSTYFLLSGIFVTRIRQARWMWWNMSCKFLKHTRFRRNDLDKSFFCGEGPVLSNNTICTIIFKWYRNERSC